jgi:hypothetical protein
MLIKLGVLYADLATGTRTHAHNLQQALVFPLSTLTGTVLISELGNWTKSYHRLHKFIYCKTVSDTAHQKDCRRAVDKAYNIYDTKLAKCAADLRRQAKEQNWTRAPIGTGSLAHELTNERAALQLQFTNVRECA